MKMPMKNMNLRKQRGQIIVFMMFAIIPLVLLMGMIFNGGYLVAQKTKLQNANDTSVLMEASWTARSLNIMSMNNTAMVQAQAITSTAFALEKPLMDAGLTSGLVAGFYVGRAWVVGSLCPPWCYLVSGIVYSAMYAALNQRVLNPLLDLQRKQKHAIHTDPESDQGFAKAAASFGRMNKILAEQFPESIEAYSDELLLANYSEEASQVRYTAWAHRDSLDRTKLDFPVNDQSLRTAAGDVIGALRNSVGDVDEDSQSTGDKVRDVMNTFLDIKDFSDVHNAGLMGSTRNPFIPNLDNYDPKKPYLVPTFNYFGNFKHQGYAYGEGPFSTGRAEAERQFKEIFEKLEGHVDGTFMADEIQRIKDSMGGGGFFGFFRDFYIQIQITIMETLIAPLAATAYDNQATDPADLANRLDEVWEWSTLYGESNYSNAWHFSGSLDLGLFEVSAPARMWRGIIPGILHGKDLSNFAEIVSDAVAIEADIADKESRAVEDCVDDRIDTEVDRIKAERLAAKRAAYEGDAPIASIELSSSEIEQAEQDAETNVRRDCRDEYNASKSDEISDVDETEPGQTSVNQGSVSGDKDAAESERDNYANQNGGGAKPGAGGNPKKVQDYLEYVNWLFEAAYQGMNLPFPVDAAIPFAMLGGLNPSRGENDWDPCIKQYVEGALCINETPTYAVRHQRLLPQFVNDQLQDFNVPAEAMSAISVLNADRNDWSLLSSASAPATLLIAPLSYGQVPTEISTIAQAEVYNAQWYDLFTQSWKAKLTPITLFDDNEHLSDIEFSWTDKMNFTDLLPVAGEGAERVLNH